MKTILMFALAMTVLFICTVGSIYLFYLTNAWLSFILFPVGAFTFAYIVIKYCVK